MLNIADKKVLVLGAGVAGRAATSFLLNQKAQPTIMDQMESPQLKLNLQGLKQAGAKISLGKMPANWQDFDLTIISPGIDQNQEWVQQIKRENIPIWGELELAWHYAAKKVNFIAITGTNGKTTTTSLLGEILKKANIDAKIGGNIGIPLIKILETMAKKSTAVVECSSFQLETAPSFAPHIAAVLNISPDHLDRHGNMENYIKAKSNIFIRQKTTDFLVLNYNDEQTKNLAQKSQGQIVWFSKNSIVPLGTCIIDDYLVWHDKSKKESKEKITKILKVNEFNLPGNHNLENALAASAMAYLAGVKPQNIAKGLREFKGVAHRLEYVATKNNITFINDSKGTNPASTVKALEAFNQPIVLIAGGRNKGGNFASLVPDIKSKVKAIVVLGEAAEDFADEMTKAGFEGKIINTGFDFNKGVKAAAQLGEPNDVVLLSPACASWDMFKSFEERGDAFKEIVKTL